MLRSHNKPSESGGERHSPARASKPIRRMIYVGKSMNRKLLVLTIAPRRHDQDPAMPGLLPLARASGCLLDDWLRNPRRASAPQSQLAHTGLESLRGSHWQFRPPGLDHAHAHHGPLLQHPVPVQICRAVRSGPCATIASLTLEPGKAGHTPTLAADLTQGPDRLLRYEVALNNHADKSAGPSNAAYSAAGYAPPRSPV